MAQLHSISILVVDDDYRYLESIREVLSREGHNILATNSAWEALELSNQQAFNLSILDVHMPELNGFEVLRQIRQIQQTPCIFMTADKSKEIKLQAMDMGAFSVLYKPIDSGVLRYTVQKAIEALESGGHPEENN